MTPSPSTTAESPTIGAAPNTVSIEDVPTSQLQDIRDALMDLITLDTWPQNTPTFRVALSTVQDEIDSRDPLGRPRGGRGGQVRPTAARIHGVNLAEGENYRVLTRFQAGNGRNVERVMVASFIGLERSEFGAEHDEFLFSLRPRAGTQTIPRRNLIGIKPTTQDKHLPRKPRTR